MKEKVYITGHRHPDTDCIVASIALAYLKNKIGEKEYQALRIGHLNSETKFVLDYFKVDPPILKDTMKLQISDIEIDNAHNINGDITLQKAFSLIQDNHLNSLPVVDENDKLTGIVSLSNITKSYMEIWDDRILYNSKTSIENILDVLNGKLICHDEQKKYFEGKMTVLAMNIDEYSGDELIDQGDVVIVGDVLKTQEYAIRKKVSLMILSNGTKLDERLKIEALKNNVTVISSEYDTFMIARLLPQAVPVSHVMSTKDLVYFNKDDYIEDVKNIMRSTRYRSYPVIDERGVVIGAISRFHLIKNIRKKLILVDHNEKNQSIADIEDAEIIEIVDHHRVANVQTDGPIFFRNEPVGSTSTIVSKMFFETGIRPSKKIAGILCAAIISDTLLFRSPTSTETDKRILHRMAKIAGIDIEKFAMEMFRAGTTLKDKSATDLINADVKIFPIADKKVRVGQIMTLNPEDLNPIKNELIDLMQKKIKDRGEDTFLLMLTDIFNETSDIIVVGEYKEEIAESFNRKLRDQTFRAKGVLSRKKQVIPKITEAIIN